MIGLTKVAPGEGFVELTERPVREPEAGEVALDVRAAGICGTDLHIWLGEYPSVSPVTMGHEVCGVVSSVGSGVVVAAGDEAARGGRGGARAAGRRAAAPGRLAARVRRRAGDGVKFVLDPR